jgi:transposase
MEVLHPHCAGLDVHKDTVVACVRHMVNATVKREVKTFDTTTKGLLALADWLASEGCTHVAMEATGIYWKPVWHVLSDGDFELVLANARHVKNVPGRKTDVNDATWLADLLAHGLIRPASCRTPRRRFCAACCGQASNWFVSEMVTSSDCRRRWKTPTSSLTR